MSNITIADFSYGHNEINTNKLTQWDTGQILRIKGLDLPPTVEIQFTTTAINENKSYSGMGITENGMTDVAIPNILLRQSKPLKVYVYDTNASSSRATKIINVPLNAKPKPTFLPDDTTQSEGESLYKTLLEKCDQAIKASAQTSADAKQTASDRLQVNSDKTEVAKIKEEILTSSGMTMTDF